MLITAYGQIVLNSWNKPFYDAISRRDLRDFIVQLGVFFVIVGVLLVLNVAQRWLVETIKYNCAKDCARPPEALAAAAPGVLAREAAPWA